ncbi:hypothetical protein [Synechococcus elongatus]|uniref:DUF1837 domain-containing protein n=1 Tax=Synechococcus elongatus PCC 11801 TaxID=2219813 RepID=A0AAN1QN67_SYNEL|nr:hypothetical protein [Synechococcus elongatus]AZB72444.1 hypothetical protein DOP62_06665 [Synechococcus elongatus PCC 11801]
MFCNWFAINKREPCPYNFLVEDITESSQPNLADPDDSILDDFAKYLLTAHADPEMIKNECTILLKDLEDVDLPIIKEEIEQKIFQKYAEEEVLPVRTSGFKGLAWFGNFGEILSSLILIKFQGFSSPIYKLRYREKTSWAMKLTDFCLIKNCERLAKPLICYGEVKTKSSHFDADLGIQGHDSLIKDDALEDPEILKFFCKMLYSREKFDEADFFSKIRLGKIAYDKHFYLFLVHEKQTWSDEILDKLNTHSIDERLENFCVSVVLIQELRKIIDESYARAWKGVREIVNG